MGIHRPESLIVTMTPRAHLIGRDGGIPWRYPQDIRHFRMNTMGKTIIMGRKCFESIKNRPLEGRRHIVLSRKGARAYKNQDVVFCSSLALALYLPEAEDAVIIGGSTIYAQTLIQPEYRPKKILITWVPDVNPVYKRGDTFFPMSLPWIRNRYTQISNRRVEGGIVHEILERKV